MNKIWKEYKKKELLSLPVRKWSEESEYMSVLLVSTRFKHDSGYNYFAVVGCKDGSTPTEIAGYMDDFWCYKQYIHSFHIDASMHGVFRLHSLNNGRNMFKVGVNTSSTDLMVGSEIKR